MNSRAIGQRIKIARESRGLSQHALAQLLTPPRTHAAVSDIERGKTQLSVEQIAEFARLLNVDIPVLLGLEINEASHQAGWNAAMSHVAAFLEKQKDTFPGMRAHDAAVRMHLIVDMAEHFEIPTLWGMRVSDDAEQDEEVAS